MKVPFSSGCVHSPANRSRHVALPDNVWMMIGRLQHCINALQLSDLLSLAQQSGTITFMIFERTSARRLDEKRCCMNR
jgi:hypothetical protein